MPEGEDTRKGNTAGLYGLNGRGLTEGTFDEDATEHLENQFFPPKDRVPYSPGYSNARTKGVTSKKDRDPPSAKH